MDALFELARREGADCLVTTEKDAVRLPENRVFPLPLFYLRLEIEIIRGASDFDEAVSRICFAQNGGPLPDIGSPAPETTAPSGRN